MDKQEYEERYGEKVIYCRKHHISGIDSCLACDYEERGEDEMVVCGMCNYKSTESNDFISVTTKASIQVQVCQGCYDSYMVEVEAVRNELWATQAAQLAYSINADYFE